MKFLMGYKTKALSILAVIAQLVGATMPQYVGICNTVTAIALSATPFTLRDAVAQLANHIKVI